MEIKHRLTRKVLWSGETLVRADLHEAGLYEADLWGADLRKADLRSANLRGADLRKADLRSANLRGANLREANLREADLREADLRGADLCGANLRTVQDAAQLGAPDDWHAFAWHIGPVVMVQVGCKSFTLDEGRAYWAGKKNRREVMAALDYAEAVAKIREWK